MAIADTMRQEGLETVLALARQGAYVFPLQAHRKVPFDKFHWKELASNDPAQVEAWAERYPGCNWALYAGKSGHIVLDLDGEAGMRWFADQVVAHGDEWTDTLYAITPGKPGKGPGRHFFYKGVAPSTNGKVAPDVDIKSDLAYVVLAPSIHPDHPNGPP